MGHINEGGVYHENLYNFWNCRYLYGLKWPLVLFNRLAETTMKEQWASLEPKERKKLMTSAKPYAYLKQIATKRQNMKASKRKNLPPIHLDFWDTLLTSDAWRVRMASGLDETLLANMDYSDFVNIVPDTTGFVVDQWDKRLTKRELAAQMYNERVLSEGVLRKKDEAKARKKKLDKRERREARANRQREVASSRNKEVVELEAGLFDYSAKKLREEKKPKPKQYKGDFVSLEQRQQHAAAKARKKQKFANQAKRAENLKERSSRLNSRQRRKLRRESERIVSQSDDSKDSVLWEEGDDEQGAYLLPANSYTRDMLERLSIDAQSDDTVVEDEKGFVYPSVVDRPFTGTPESLSGPSYDDSSFEYEEIYDQAIGIFEKVSEVFKGMFMNVPRKIIHHMTSILIQLVNVLFDVYCMGISPAIAAVRFVGNVIIEGIKFSAKWIKDVALPAVVGFIKHVRSFITWNKASSIIDRIRTFMSIAVASDLARSLYKVLRVVFLAPWFGVETVGKYFSVFGLPSRRFNGVLDIFECLCDGLSGLLRAGSAISAGVPINQILFADNPISTFIMEAEWVKNNVDNVYIGLPVDGMYSLNELRRRTNSAVVAGDTLLKDMPFWDSQTSQISRLLSDVKNISKCLEIRAKSNGRLPPYAFVLHGPAGIGKSTLRNIFYSVHSSIMEREFDESQVFARDITSEYFEGYEPLSMPYWHYAEVGNEHVNIAMHNGNNVLAELQRICDTTPFPCNMAAVDLKGKYYASPEMIFIDTNNPGMHIKSLMSFPAASMRRLCFAEMSVKEPYRKNGSTEIDGKLIATLRDDAIAAGREFDPMDVYDCKLYRYITNARDFRENVIFQGSFPGMLEALRSDMIDHIGKNSRSKDLFSNPQDIVMKYLLSQDGSSIESKEDPWFSEDEFSIPLDLNQVPIEAQSFPSSEEAPNDVENFCTILRARSDTLGTNWSEEDIKTSAIEMDRKLQSIRKTRDTGKPTAFEWFFRLFSSLFMWILYTVMSKLPNLLPTPEMGMYIIFSCAFLFLWGPIGFFVGALISVVTVFATLLRFLGVSSNPREHRSHAQYYRKSVFSLLGRDYMIYLGKQCCAYTSLACGLGLLAGCIFRKRHALRDIVSRYGPRARHYATLGVSPWRVLEPIAAENQEVRGIPENYDESFLKLSTKAGCIKGVIRTKDGGVNQWVDYNSTDFKALHQGDLESLENIALRNTIEVYVHVTTGLMKKKSRTHLLLVKGNYALINKHVLAGSDGIFYIDVPIGCNSITEATSTSQIVGHVDRLTEVTTDVYLLALAYRNGRDLTCHFARGVCTPGACRFNGVDSIVSVVRGVELTDYNTIFADCYAYNVPTKKGDCGLPLVTRVGNSGSVIAGIHVGGKDNRGFSVPITVDMINRAIESTYTIMAISSQSDFDHELLEPTRKSPFVHESFLPLEYIGRVPGPILLKNKSKMVRTPFAPIMDDVLSLLGASRTQTFMKPVMKPKNVDGCYVSPYNVNLRKMAKPMRSLDAFRLMRIRDKLVDRIVTMLRDRGVDSLSPVLLETAINGFEDDDYYRRINMNASAGFGLPGKKIEYFHDCSVDDRKNFVLKEEVVANLTRCLETYGRGERCHFIYKAQLKDEPRPIEKVLTGSTRLFYMSNLENLLLSRMFLGPFYTLMVQHGDIFRTSVGINIHDEADALVRDMLEVGDNFIEFDYSGFDVSNVFDIAQCASSVVLGVLAEFGYNAYSLEVVRGLLSDTLFPIVELNKDLFTKPGMQMSGRYATAEDNSLRNLIMLIYAWENLYDDDFFECTRVNTFGDDVVGSVDSDHLGFNNLYYQDFARVHYGMVVTPAVKGNDMAAFMTVDEISYLKRNFVLREGVYVAPIDVNTIYKMMEWRIPSSSITDMEQYIAMTISCLWEVFFHCERERYDRIRNMFVEVLVNHFSLPASYFYERFPTYDFLYTEKIVCKPSFNGRVNGNVRLDPESEVLEEEDRCLSCVPLSEIQTRHGPLLLDQSVPSSYQWINKELLDRIDSLESELKEIEHELNRLADGSEDLYRYKFQPDNVGSVSHRTGVVYTLLARKKSIETTIKFLRKRISIVAQSDTVEMKLGPPDSEVKVSHDTFEDVGGDATCSRESGDSVVVKTSQITRHHMEGVLSRPVKIVSISVPTGATIRQTYRVWDLFTLDPTVRAKLRNFAYLRGDLHLRVTISGTPFHFGKIVFSYQPMAARNANLGYHANQSIFFGETAVPSYINYLTQSPGCVIADVKTNKPFEMKLPYISHKAMGRLFNTSQEILDDTDSYADFEELGTLYVYSINTIRSVSEAPSNVHMHIVAWMEDVKLGTPTASVSIVAEADERETGPVERISTALAKSLGYLGEIPVIGPYAQASSIAFSFAAEVASFFGWSRPLVVDDPVFVKPRPVGNMATGIGFDTAEKLTMDPKQEIALDPRCCGVETDDMAFENVYTRWSYLTSFDWLPDDNSLSEVLWRCAITPNLCTTFNSAVRGYFQPTAMAFCAAPFRYWNGAIEVRIEIECSAFHRGKLAILYEPNVNHQLLVCNSISTNKNHMKVIDLQETQVMDFCINWAHKRMWAETYSQGDSHSLFGDTFDINEERQNGFIALTPYTKLQSPDNSGVTVNVYVRGKDLSFSYLDMTNVSRERISAQSDELQCEAVTCISLNEPTYGLNDSSTWHFGETYGSFRVALKRYSLIDERDVQNSPGGSTRTFVYNGEIMPKPTPFYGSVTNRDPHLIQFLLYAYLGVKGSLRYKAHFSSSSEIFNRGHRINVTLASPTDVYGGVNLNYSNSGLNSLSTGTLGFMPSVSSSVEIEAPFFTTNMFLYSFANDHVGANPTGDMSTLWVRRFTVAGEVSTPPTYLRGTLECAIGEDFSLLRFSGAPAYSGAVIS